MYFLSAGSWSSGSPSVLSGVCIAEEVEGVGDKVSGGKTMVDAEAF